MADLGAEDFARQVGSSRNEKGRDPLDRGLLIGAPGMARCAKRNQLGCGGHADDLEVKVLYTPGKGKC